MRCRRARVEAALTQPSLEALLTELVARARAAWPAAWLSPEELVRHLAAKLPAESNAELALRQLPVEDLYLACACASGNAEAIAAFERDQLRTIDGPLVQLDISASVAEEVKQVLRERLLVASDQGRPKIADYSGAGSLRNWVRVAAVREALLLLRKGRRERSTPDELLAELPDPADDLELRYIRERHRADFRQALVSSLAELTRRQRNVLRHYFIYKMSIDQISAIYHVHRATAARWIARAQDQLLVAMRSDLKKRLRISSSECDSLMRVLHGQLEVTLQRILGADEERGPQAP